MFRCGKCNQTTLSHQPVNRVVVQQRSKTYTNVIQRGFNEKVVDSTGWEIGAELLVCPTCYKDMTGLDPVLFEPPPTVVPANPPEDKRKNHRKHRYNNDNSNKNNTHKNQNNQPRNKPVVEVVPALKK